MVYVAIENRFLNISMALPGPRAKLVENPWSTLSKTKINHTFCIITFQSRKRQCRSKVKHRLLFLQKFLRYFTRCGWNCISCLIIPSIVIFVNVLIKYMITIHLFQPVLPNRLKTFQPTMNESILLLSKNNINSHLNLKVSINLKQM